MRKGGNVAASVRARLKNRADAKDEDYNLLLTRYYIGPRQQHRCNKTV